MHIYLNLKFNGLQWNELVICVFVLYKQYALWGQLLQLLRVSRMTNEKMPEV